MKLHGGELVRRWCEAMTGMIGRLSVGGDEGRRRRHELVANQGRIGILGRGFARVSSFLVKARALWHGTAHRSVVEI